MQTARKTKATINSRFIPVVTVNEWEIEAKGTKFTAINPVTRQEINGFYRYLPRKR